MIVFSSLRSSGISRVGKVLQALPPKLALWAHSRVSPALTLSCLGVRNTLSASRVIHGAKVNTAALLAKTTPERLTALHLRRWVRVCTVAVELLRRLAVFAVRVEPRIYSLTIARGGFLLGISTSNQSNNVHHSKLAQKIHVPTVCHQLRDSFLCSKSWETPPWSQLPFPLFQRLGHRQ